MAGNVNVDISDFTSGTSTCTLDKLWTNNIADRTSLLVSLLGEDFAGAAVAVVVDVDRGGVLTFDGAREAVDVVLLRGVNSSDTCGGTVVRRLMVGIESTSSERNCFPP